MYYDEYIEHKEELLKADEIIIKPYKRVVLQYYLNNNFINFVYCHTKNFYLMRYVVFKLSNYKYLIVMDKIS